MPDHLHMLISFSWHKSAGMSTLMKSRKRYIAKQCNIQWQRDFFDHRIRNQEDFNQKWDYIINNHTTRQFFWEKLHYQSILKTDST
ncbi:hypothetical protein ACFSQZ_04800, partial [Rubritalea spongiae]